LGLRAKEGSAVPETSTINSELPRTGLFLPGEAANALTHGAGAFLSLAALCVLLGLTLPHGDPWRVIGCGVYGLSLLTLYTCSALAHAARSQRKRKLLERLDHAAIYGLIAGTYTPFALVNLRDGIGWLLLGAVWSMAIAGMILKMLFGTNWQRLSLAGYIGMGWFAVLTLKPLADHVPVEAIAWLVAGGIAYTVGVPFYVSKGRHAHAIWHLFVIIGSACHFLAVLNAAVLPEG
jgi:hemolysin III